MPESQLPAITIPAIKGIPKAVGFENVTHCVEGALRTVTCMHMKYSYILDR